MTPVDKGILTIKTDKKKEIVIEYLFSLRIILIICGIAGILIAIFSSVWSTGLLAFLWLGGMNWIIAVIRHKVMFGSLINELKEKI